MCPITSTSFWCFPITSTSFWCFYNNFYITSCLYVVYYCLKKEESSETCNGKNSVDFDFPPTILYSKQNHGIYNRSTETREITASTKIKTLAEKQMKSSLHARFSQNCIESECAPEGTLLKKKIYVALRKHAHAIYSNISRLQTI